MFTSNTVSSFSTFHKQVQVAIFPILEGIILFQILLIATIIMSKYYMQGLVLLKCTLFIFILTMTTFVLFISILQMRKNLAISKL